MFLFLPVALQVAGMLNDAGLSLQAVVMIYGLMSPLLQCGISLEPLLQVTERLSDNHFK